MTKAKPFQISKVEIWESYKTVKSNKGAAGVDNQSIEDFEKDLSGNLYKIWNRMSSGCYFPSPVLRVEIPKEDGSFRPLGIPTVSDRIVQTVAKRVLEPELERVFHPGSFGYRPKRSTIQAVGEARKNCWRYDWVLDLDIKGFFDNIDHELMMKAVRKHTASKWVILYIERWLKTPVLMPDGSLQSGTKGTPQGGVISPLLANLFLHYAFDQWIETNCSDIPFERYADDAVCHYKSEKQAKWLKESLEKRMAECRLELHPIKTKIVYCRDADRKDRYINEAFDFLGYTFRQRMSKNRWGKFFMNFSPAVSNKALKRIRQTIREWKLHLRSDKSLEDLAQMYNSNIRGWITYYGKFYKSMLYPTFRHLDVILSRWSMRKFKTLKNHKRRARHWIERIAQKETKLFAHWSLLYGKC